MEALVYSEIWNIKVPDLARDIQVVFSVVSSMSKSWPSHKFKNKGSALVNKKYSLAAIQVFRV